MRSVTLRLMILATAFAAVASASNALAQCTSPPRFFFDEKTCPVGTSCPITVSIDPGTNETASIAGRVNSSFLTCQAGCTKGPATATADGCTVNSTSNVDNNCKFTVFDFSDPSADPFGAGV